MRQKFFLLKEEFKEKGIFYGLRRVIFYLLRPITSLIQRSRFLVELRYGFFPGLMRYLSFYKTKPRIIRLPRSELVRNVRKFWYSNVPGNFDLDGEKISRRDIFTYGGPDPKFTCPVCQKAEWLSRVKQKNLFVSHNCPQAKECEDLCKKQGDEMWAHYHQNFDFSVGCDSDLPAPKCLFPVYKNLGNYKTKKRFFNPDSDMFTLVFRRQLSYVCQVEVVEGLDHIDWANYDFLLLVNSGYNQKFSRPNIPIVLLCHDFWLENKNFQFMLDWLQPDVLLTQYPAQWKENFNLPPKNKVVFFPFFDSSFFARPNLINKKFNLLVIGATTVNSVYRPRFDLDKQILELSRIYNIEFSHLAGASNVFSNGPLYRKDFRTGLPIRLLNKWSEYLSLAEYVIFGRVGDPVKQFLLAKYYEVLGSGAIPIFPEVPDLKLLGVKAFEHYIPLSEVEGNNKKLAYYLDNYEKFKYIAENAVKWYKEKSDRMIFNDFEDMIRKITNYKYPERLV